MQKINNIYFTIKIYFYQMKVFLIKIFKEKHKYMNEKIMYFNFLLFEFLKDNRSNEKVLKQKLYDTYTDLINLCIQNGEIDKKKFTFIFTNLLPKTSVDFLYNFKLNFPFAYQPKIKEIFDNFFLELYFQTKNKDWLEFEEFENLLKGLKKESKTFLNSFEKQSKLRSKKEIKRNFLQNLKKELECIK